MYLKGSGARMSGARWRSVVPNRSGLDPLYIKISDSGGLDLEAWCLDACMLAGLEWIGGGDGGDGNMGRGDWKKFSHAQASGARRISVKLCGSLSGSSREVTVHLSVRFFGRPLNLPGPLVSSCFKAASNLKLSSTRACKYKVNGCACLAHGPPLLHGPA